MHYKGLEFCFTVASGSSRAALKQAARRDTVEKDGDTIDLSTYPAPESVMVSYATKNNTPWPGPSWTIDSGGYSTLTGMGSYESSCTEYVEWVREQEQRDGVDIDRFVLRDWACEQDILREYGRTVEDHQRWTIRDHITCHDHALACGVEAEPMSVLQGYDVRDYLSFVDDLRDYGLLTDHLGIGTICRRRQLPQIRNTILKLRDDLPSRISLHGFGVKRSVLQSQAVVDALESVDTAAWENSVYWDSIANQSRDGHRYTWDRVLDAYHDYRREIRSLIDDADTQRPLNAADRDAVGDETSVPAVGLSTRTLSDWSSQPYMDVGAVELECICGTTINPRSLAEDGSDDVKTGCRHCETAITTMYTRRFITGPDRAHARRIAQDVGPNAQSFRLVQPAYRTSDQPDADDAPGKPVPPAGTAPGRGRTVATAAAPDGGS